MKRRHFFVNAVAAIATIFGYKPKVVAEEAQDNHE